ELHVVHVLTHVGDRGPGLALDVLAGGVQLMLDVDVRGGDERVDRRALGVAHRLPRAVVVGRVGARDAADHLPLDVAGERMPFLDLHRPGDPLLMPNPWDVGSARLLESLRFQALATTSSGFAASLGRLDGSVSRDEAVAHAATIVAATEVPVSADFENCFAHE